MRAEYAGKVWEANISDLGLDKSEVYNFLITSSQRQEHLKVYMQMVG